MPRLDVAPDSATMTSHLRPRLSSMSDPSNGLSVIDSQVLDSKPGKRALIRFELKAPAGRRKIEVFGKTYSDREQLARIDQVMNALWHDVFSGDIRCGVPQPLGVVPELSMFLYLPAEGAFLDEVQTDSEAIHAMNLTARWLGALHRYPLRIAKRFDLANELVNLGVWASLVGRTYPALASMAHSLLFHLQHEAEMLPFETETPIHKDFHYRHVLVGRGVKVIDFDEVRLGDRNFDLAHFSANLHLLAYRQHGAPDRLQKLESHFLRSYARSIGQSRSSFAGSNRDRFAYFYGYTCLKIARQLCLGFGPSPVPVDDEQRHQVEMILNQGLNAVIKPHALIGFQ